MSFFKPQMRYIIYSVKTEMKLMNLSLSTSAQWKAYHRLSTI